MANAPGSNDTLTLNGLFKETYASEKKQLIPDGKIVINTIKFLERQRQPGNQYHQPVVLGMEHGITFADDAEGAFALNPPIAGQIKDAVVKGYQLLLRSVMSYGAASRAMGGEPKAFEDATKFLVGNMMDSVAKKLEIELIYGQMGYSVVENAEAAASNVVIELVDAEFAPGIWAGAENMPLDVVRSGTLVPTLSGVNAIVVKSVDLTAKTITCDLPAALVAGDVLYHKGAYTKEFAGIHKILTNSGTLFGIDSSVYTLWKGSAFAPATTSVLSFAILQQAISKGVEKGLDTDVMVLVNPGHWDDLLTEQAALRVYDQSYSSDTAEQGARKIKFHSQNGMVEIVPSIHVKEGYSYVIAKEDWIRVGSTDITFKRPGQEGNFFRELTDHAGYELRCYTDQALFCSKPGRSIIISNLKVS